MATPVGRSSCCLHSSLGAEGSCRSPQIGAPAQCKSRRTKTNQPQHTLPGWLMACRCIQCRPGRAQCSCRRCTRCLSSTCRRRSRSGCNPTLRRKCRLRCTSRWPTQAQTPGGGRAAAFWTVSALPRKRTRGRMRSGAGLLRFGGRAGRPGSTATEVTLCGSAGRLWSLCDDERHVGGPQQVA